MPNAFVISDTHFSHRNIITFEKAPGIRLRPFSSVEEMDELMIERWNAVVKPGDRVYHLGDVAINRHALPKILPRLHGRKCLIKGNHDIFKLRDYLPYFDDIRAMKVLTGERVILTHVPIHPCNLLRFRGNIHGHMHEHVVMRADGLAPDMRYYSVCVERHGYTPLDLSFVLKVFAA